MRTFRLRVTKRELQMLLIICLVMLYKFWSLMHFFLTKHNVMFLWVDLISNLHTLLIILGGEKNPSSGKDGISTNIFKDNICVLAPILFDIFKTSLNEAIMPDEFKIATMVPVYKVVLHRFLLIGQSHWIILWQAYSSH